MTLSLRERVFLSLGAALLALSLPVGLVAQTRAGAARPAVEPVRVASGLMTGNRIAIRRSDWIRAGAPLYEYVLTGATLADGRLEFTGTLRAGAQPPATVRSTLLATTARSANPWPGASSATARERKAGQPPRGEGERNEQTQSLYSGATDAGSGCELIYLKLAPPHQTAPMQIGVVLAPQDNDRGNEINHVLCRIVRGLQSKANVAADVAKLHQLLAEK